MAGYPPRPSTPPQRADSLPLSAVDLSPRSASRASRQSPRLDQDSFDAANNTPSSHLWPRTTPFYTVPAPSSGTSSPSLNIRGDRHLHPDPLSSSPPAQSSETLHIIASPDQESHYDAYEHEERVQDDYEEESKDDFKQWAGAGYGDELGGTSRVTYGGGMSKPPHLDLSNSSQPVSNVRFSTTSTVLGLPASPSSPSPPSPPSTEPKKHLIQPTVSLLFSLTPRNSQLVILLPAIFLAIVCGLIPPYMTELLGQAFQAFTTYSLETASPTLTTDELSAARAKLLSSAKNSSIQFSILAGLVLACASICVSLWVINGERTITALRLEVFKGVGGRSMEWFDLGMGAEDNEGEEEGEGGAGQGAGGLMGRFTKETDDARVAASQTVGLLIQYLVSFIASLVLSLYRSYLLTFVILASVPIIVLIVSVTERLAAPLSDKDREFTSKSASRLDRIIGAIPTVKAFNAEAKELSGFKAMTARTAQNYTKLHLVWGARAGMTQFVMSAMFVQGFWFGAFLVRTGRATPAAVNTCFWACLVATNYLQMCVPMLVQLEKGKMAMASLLELAREGPKEPVAVCVRPTSSHEAGRGLGRFNSRNKGRKARARVGSLEGSEPFATKGLGHGDVGDRPLSPHHFHVTSPTSSHTPITPTFIPLATANSGRRRKGAAPRALRKLCPATFTGELSLRNVTFHYPSRPAPAPPALDNVSLYLAAKETTYIVGASGSGKSTVGSLLLGLYRPEAGKVEVDEQGLEWIEEDWLRGHVACVSQGASILLNGTVHDNVAIGVVGQLREDGSRRLAKDVTRDEVVAACRGALMHEFIRDLPDGYDTWLSGEKGASLSGGQRQRLAIARAWIRDPTVLILDEATSALDATSRLLVSDAVKLWRKNKTTVIITHDLTPVNPEDFVYVMTNGCVVEQGYREDLEANVGGPFHQLAHTQLEAEDASLDEDEDDAGELDSEVLSDTEFWARQEMYTPRIEITEPDYTTNVFGGALFAPAAGIGRSSQDLRKARHASAVFVERQETRSSISANRPPLPRHASSRRSMQIADAPPPGYDYSHFSSRVRPDSSMSFGALDRAAETAMGRRAKGVRIKHKTMIDGEIFGKGGSTAPKSEGGTLTIMVDKSETKIVTMSTRTMITRFYPTIPNKFLFWAGLFLCVGVGACIPVFSTLLAKLMANLGNPNNGSVVLVTSLLILLLALIEGVGGFLKFYFLERCAMGWIASLRTTGLALVLKQDKTFFDNPTNTTSSLVHSLIKDSEDARTLIGTVVGQLVVITSMIFIGLTWAFVVGWELTLVGLGLAPVFILATRAQADVLSRFEARNKVMREEVSKRFHQNISNIRAIRSMSIETVFAETFAVSARKAYAGAAKAAPWAGMGYALGSCLTYVAEAIMIYVGAVLISIGRYDFAKMIQVFTLIIFSITFSASVMTYLPAMTKSIRACIDLSRLLDLGTETAETEGRMTFPINGHITFDNVGFSYPQRPDIPILKGMSFDVKAGECVGIVGASGSGKSTVVSLLQRLYEPESGSILLDGRSLDRTDVRYLRDHIAIVSQHPALFDMTIAENIAYGSSDLSEKAIIAAAQAAHVHDFIVGLPKGYQTMLGENASLISGGQAQRLQIARALVRPREILILDECTSALDPTNQAAVMDTIMSVKEGKTTLIVTHKLAVMEMCDRLIVVDAGGRVAETGTVVELRAKVGGLFASLASGGEWESS